MLLSALLAVTVTATVPTPLPEIYHEVASPFCTALREKIGPALYGLSLNNKILKQGDGTMVRMAHDYIASSGVSMDSALTLDTARLRDLSQHLAYNVSVIDKILATATPDPKHPSKDDAALEKLKESLEKVKAAQSIAINILSGSAETQSLDDFMNEGNDMMSAGLGPELSNSKQVQSFGAGPMTDGARSSLLVSKNAVASQALANDPAIDEGDPFALRSPVSRLYEALLVDQRLTNDASQQAAALVIASANSCRTK